MRALRNKADAKYISADSILAEQLRDKPGGQIVEIEGNYTHPKEGVKNLAVTLCQLPNENWALVHF